jgi:hypothetical protein
MKKIVLTFGLLSGLLLSAMLLLSIPLWDRIGMDSAELLGYTTMVAAALFIYFGVRRYRDDVAGGTVSFGRGFLVGMLIAVVANACYTVTWETVFFTRDGFGAEFVARYQEQALAEARAKGASEADLARQRTEMAWWTERYQNPAFNAAITFVEPMPVALVFALGSAGILSRRRRRRVGAAGVAQTV